MSSRPTRASRKLSPTAPQATPTEPQSGTFTPLSWMLHVINDPTAAPERRDRMAIAAAQYVHQRAVYTRQSKKAAPQQAANQTGDEWGGDLAFDGRRPQ